jgi:hypothetical protein
MLTVTAHSLRLDVVRAFSRVEAAERLADGGPQAVDGALIDAPPRPAGRVSVGDRIEGLLAFDGRRACRSARPRSISPTRTSSTVAGSPATRAPNGGGFDTADVVAELKERRITPHVAQNACDTGKAERRSTIDGRTTRHAGDAASQQCRKRIEEVFGWLETVAGWRKSRFRGQERTAATSPSPPAASPECPGASSPRARDGGA